MQGNYGQSRPGWNNEVEASLFLYTPLTWLEMVVRARGGGHETWVRRKTIKQNQAFATESMSKGKANGRIKCFPLIARDTFTAAAGRGGGEKNFQNEENPKNGSAFIKGLNPWKNTRGWIGWEWDRGWRKRVPIREVKEGIGKERGPQNSQPGRGGKR